LRNGLIRRKLIVQVISYRIFGLLVFGLRKKVLALVLYAYSLNSILHRYPQKHILRHIDSTFFHIIGLHTLKAIDICSCRTNKVILIAKLLLQLLNLMRLQLHKITKIVLSLWFIGYVLLSLVYLICLLPKLA